MNRITAIRCFGNSRYTPAKKDVNRIMDAKFYLVTLQDFETDQGDGQYLLDTETTTLFCGRKAREERDSRMNRCNRIVEYTGPVFQLQNDRYPFYCRGEGDQLFISEQAARAYFDKTWDALATKEARELDICRVNLAKPRAQRAAEDKARYPLITPEHLEHELDRREQTLRERIACYENTRKPTASIRYVR